MKLEDTGQVKITKQTLVRRECDDCEADADQKHTYLLPNARSNPASSGYRGDDISWCSDKETYSCGTCREELHNGQVPKVEGYEHCSTYTSPEMYPHLFLVWVDEDITEEAREKGLVT